LDDKFSYAVEKPWFVPAYRDGVWDGRIRLHRRQRGSDNIVVPTGMLGDAIEILRAHAVEVDVDVPPRTCNLFPLKREGWDGLPLRRYQTAAVKAAMRAGRGVLKLPIRSGKTLIAARLIYQLRSRALFVVSSELLMDQALKAFRLYLPKLTIGQFGAGRHDVEQDLVVCTVQALSKGHKLFDDLVARRDVAVYDEAHHAIAGEEWRKTLLNINAPHKYGLSATVTDELTPDDREGLWLRAICGPVFYRRSMAEMVEEGWVLRPTVKFVRHGAGQIVKAKGVKKIAFPTLYGLGISNCPERNEKIVDCAVQAAKAATPCLVDVGRVTHGRELMKLLKGRLPAKQVALMIGSTKREARRRILKMLRDGTVRVVVSTVMGEGIDIPELEAVVNAEGGKSYVGTLQRFRNLTPCDGRDKKPVLYDCVDTHHDTFRSWSAERLKIYRAEQCFRFRVEE
jgi:superfamily II DNA or RNA helicase